jgi:hypothetical protein
MARDSEPRGAAKEAWQATVFARASGVSVDAVALVALADLIIQADANRKSTPGLPFTAGGGVVGD